MMKVKAVVAEKLKEFEKVKLKNSDLQTDKYTYTWTTDDGDDPDYIDKKDRIRVDKDEGYEVRYFIQDLINDYSELKKSHIHTIEDTLHSDDLSKVVMREELEEKVLSKLEVSLRKTFTRFIEDNS